MEQLGFQQTCFLIHHYLLVSLLSTHAVTIHELYADVTYLYLWSPILQQRPAGRTSITCLHGSWAQLVRSSVFVRDHTTKTIVHYASTDVLDPVRPKTWSAAPKRVSAVIHTCYGTCSIYLDQAAFACASASIGLAPSCEIYETSMGLHVRNVRT